jgi:hypothetical protein
MTDQRKAQPEVITHLTPVPNAHVKPMQRVNGSAGEALQQPLHPKVPRKDLSIMQRL